MIIKRNHSSIFIEPVLEKGGIDIVNNSKIKTSTDNDDLDMKIVKAAIKGISGPLTHIYNLSFQTGQLPHKMKITKVIPSCKSVNKHLITGQSYCSPNSQKYEKNCLQRE